MTGMNQWQAGILGMGAGQGQMGVNFPFTLPGELAKHGWYTKGVGKMHFHPQRALLGFHSTVLDESGRVAAKGFVSDYHQWFARQETGGASSVDHGIDWNSWMARPWHLPESLHPTCWTAGEALRFLKDRDPSMPFFLKVSFARPHSPYDPPQYFFDLYKDKKLPGPFIGDWADVNDVPSDAAVFDAWRGRRSDEETRRARMAYYGQISHIDNQIGRILIYLKDNKLMDDTLFIFTSDHGDMLGDHNLWRKTYAYEGSAHIPLVMKLPREMRGSVKPRSGGLASLCDIMPTILDVLDLPVPDAVDGKSLVKPATGNADGWREYFHGEHCACYAPDNEMQFVTDGRYKYVWLPRADTEQFFDLQEDPGELHNAIADENVRPHLERLRGFLIQELARRENGMVRDGRLASQKGKPPQVSPHYRRRLETSPYNWES
jgi:arylsulfatase A-like enzyme